MPSRAALTVLCAAQFVLILDVAVVNVAVVPVAREFGVSADSLGLIGSAYAATFGGLLLAGGRLADGGRRRRIFIAGLAVFALGSALCGLAPSLPVLIAGRAVQGLGAALASPAALSLVTTVFTEPAARARALGTWAAVAAAGGAAGLIAGGVLTEVAGWRSVFMINLPLGAVIVAAGLRVLPAGVPTPGRPRWDVWSIAAAAGFLAAVAVLVGALQSLESGLTAGSVTGVEAGLVLGAAAFGVQRRASAPLLPTRLFRVADVGRANLVTAAMSAVVIGVNFFLAVELQSRLGFDPLAAGLAFLPITAVSAVSALVSARLSTRFSIRALLAFGLGAMAVGCVTLTATSPPVAYASGVLPGIVLVAAGMGPAFAVGSMAATAGVPETRQGAAAALLSTSTQVGAAIGLAALNLVAAGGEPGPARAYAAMAGLAGLAAVVALGIGARPRPPAIVPPAVPAQAGGCLPGCAALNRTPATPATT